MKASLKFRDDQKPLVRAKIPVSILGLPFQSGISAGDSQELRLDMGTAFESGPSFRVSYRPNDSWNPFSLVVKIGIGAFGSPASTPMSMSAEFNFVGRGSPSFSIQLKPRIGDFCIKKTTQSAGGSLTSPIVVDQETDGDGNYSGKKAKGISMGLPTATVGGVRGLLSGAEVTARSVLPLWNRAAVNLRWGVRIPSEFTSAFADEVVMPRKDPTAVYSLRKLPLLVMSKISIEHVAVESKPEETAAELVEACSSVQKQLAALQAENGLLRKAVEELRADFTARRSNPVTGSQFTARSTCPDARDGKGVECDSRNGGGKAAAPGKNGNNGRRGDWNGSELGGKVTKEDVNEELKKALMGATGAGI